MTGEATTHTECVHLLVDAVLNTLTAWLTFKLSLNKPNQKQDRDSDGANGTTSPHEETVAGLGWAGLSMDPVIEQVLMRSMKISGSLTRGRGKTEQQRCTWLLFM